MDAPRYVCTFLYSALPVYSCLRKKNREELVEEYQYCIATIIPSNWFENFPTTNLEASYSDSNETITLTQKPEFNNTPDYWNIQLLYSNLKGGHSRLAEFSNNYILLFLKLKTLSAYIHTTFSFI